MMKKLSVTYILTYIITDYPSYKLINKNRIKLMPCMYKARGKKNLSFKLLLVVNLYKLKISDYKIRQF